MPHNAGAHRRHLSAGYFVLAFAITIVGAWWLNNPLAGTPVGAHAVGTALFALPLALITVPVALIAARRRWGPEVLPTWLGTAVAAPVAAAALAAGAQMQSLFSSATTPLAVALVRDLFTALVVVVPMAFALLALRGVTTRRLTRRSRPVMVFGVCVATVAVTCVATASTPAVAAPPAPSSCLSGGAATKTYDITALDVDIPVNRFGDHDPGGKMYALNSKLNAIKDQVRSQQVSIGLRDDPVQALVIRANQGDCVEIRYTNNATGGDFGVHIDGLEFNMASSGDSVGANPSSAVPTGKSTTYRFAVPNDDRMEGAHYIHPGPGYRAAVDHGLFGTLVIEPPGSTYWNTSTPNKPLDSGWEAIIKPAGAQTACVPSSHVQTCGFRENVLLHHEIGNDNETLTDRDGKKVPQVDDTTGSYRPGGFALNYRSEPFRNRLLPFPKEKSHAYSSYTFGDPATPMPRGYLSDPTKLRILHAGGEKFHIFHLHGGGDRWRYNPVADTTYNYADTGLRKDPQTTLSPSQRLDSQSLGPGESYNLEIEGGAGGVQQSAGDFLFHCHIAKHYVSGMWSFWRVYDSLQPDLVPLPDRTAPAPAVDSTALIGKTITQTAANGTATTVTLTKDNVDAWIRPQLPPSGVDTGGGQDPTVWDWKTTGTTDKPVYLGAPADGTLFPDSANVIPGQPNLLPVDRGNVIENRPKILFNPVNGRPAYPMFRTHIGQRPPFTPAGHSGAPWLGNNTAQTAKSATDPFAGRQDGLCPTGRPTRQYNVVAIAKPIQRSATEVDPEGKIFTLAKDKEDVYANRKPSDPLAIRANQGDCIGVSLTNEIPDKDAFDGVSKTTMHIHHVQFDVQGSDGVSAGFAYEHSVRPYQFYDYQLVSNAAKGDTTLRLSSVDKFLRVDANGKASQAWIAIGEGTNQIEVRQILSVDAANKTVTLTSPLDGDHVSGQWAGTEYIQYRWYPDVLLDNIFWHDHVDGIHGWGHGLVGQLIVEPAGSTYHDPVTGKQVDSGTLVDIHTTNTLSPGLVTGSYRELALWTIDDNDKDAYSTLNLRNSPLKNRPDPANKFSSYTNGDPETPLPRMYPNDPLVIRTINVGPSIDTLHLQGGKTLLEPRYTENGKPHGTVIDTIHYGVSEKYTLIFNGNQPDMKMRPGDYLYANGDERRTQDGAWGVVRVLPGSVPSLQPLPDAGSPSGSYTLPAVTGKAPPAATGPGNPCAANAPKRDFSVTAMDVPGAVSANRRGGGGGGGGARTAYVPDNDVSAVKSGGKNAEPLVLHVAAGECVTVHLTNTRSAAVGFSVAKLDRDAGSGGANVGFSPQQNTSPGATRDYVYFAGSDRVGTADIADLAGSDTMKSGLYGAVVVAPQSTLPGQRTTFTDPVTGAVRDVGTQVLVHVPGAATPHYRDFTTVMADDDARIGQDFMPYPTNAVAGKALINYQAAPAGDGPNAFRTPGPVKWQTSYAGEPVVVHAVVAPGSENAHVFSLGGLNWPVDPNVYDANWVPSQGMGPWETFDAWIVGGAGGSQQTPGDYFYGDLRRPFTQIGLWGLQRVLPATRVRCPVLRVDNSTC
jgi:hypothetical protein